MVLILLMGVWTRAGEIAPRTPASREVTGACACVTSKVCWNLVMTAYQTNVKAALTEIEGALPNRFAPGVDFSALHKPDEQGHFLKATCGSKRAVCSDKRDVMERNLILSRFLASLPLSAANGSLFNPVSWAITEGGEKTIAEARRCKPDLFRLLTAVVQK